MKKLRLLSLIVFVPIAVGLLCCIIGGFTNNVTLSTVGYYIFAVGVPAIMFILVVVGLVLMMTGRLHGNGADDNSEVDRVSRAVSANYKHSSLKTKILGWLFFSFLMGDFALILVFLFLEITLGAMICFGIFVGTIILTLLIQYIVKKVK